MRKFIPLIFLVCILSAPAVNAQDSSDSLSSRYGGDQNTAPLLVTNPGFETANYTAWSGYTGENTVSSTGPLQNQTAGIFSGSVDPAITDQYARQSIMSNAAGNDPVGGFPIVPAGYGNYVARLGNSYAQYQGQEIEQSWTVTPADSAFLVSYAVVMPEDGHTPGTSCYFRYDIVDASSNQVSGRYDEANALPTTYLSAPNNMRYLPWTIDTIDLSAYIGTTLTIRFIVAGCVYGGDYAWCYIDLDPNNTSIGIAENEVAPLNVYPNPSATGVFHISETIPGPEEKPRVYDMRGRLVDAIITPTADGWTIDISALASGMYSVNVPTIDGIARCTVVRP